MKRKINQMNNTDISKSLNNGLTKEGVLIYEGTPFYIVDFFFVDGRIPFIAGFAIKKSSKADYKKTGNINVLSKDYDLVEEQSTKYRFTTGLSTFLKDNKNLKETEKRGNIKRYREPLFVTPVVDGTSTLTDKYSLSGFYEKSINNKSTGIFISMEDITWFEDKRELLIMIDSLMHLGESYVDNYFTELNTDSNGGTSMRLNYPEDTNGGGDLKW